MTARMARKIKSVRATVWVSSQRNFPARMAHRRSSRASVVSPASIHPLRSPLRAATHQNYTLTVVTFSPFATCRPVANQPPGGFSSNRDTIEAQTLGARVRVGVVVFPGSNCERDTLHVLTDVLHLPADLVWHEQTDLSPFDCIILPGG